MEQEQKQQQQQQSSSLLSVEQQRAIELDELLGPKFVDDTADANDIKTSKKKQKTDFIIDLHTTTTIHERSTAYRLKRTNEAITVYSVVM